MLYWLSEIFNINLLGYITVRAGISFFLALFFTLFLMPRFIRWAQATSSVQPINDWAPQRHQEKAKTPTMGGIVFVSATVLASLLSIKFSNLYALGAVAILVLFAFIGFQDDIAKIKKNENLAGLKARTKLLLQTIFAFAMSLFLYNLGDFNTQLYVPFLKNPVLAISLPFSVSIILICAVLVVTFGSIQPDDISVEFIVELTEVQVVPASGENSKRTLSNP